MQELNRSISRKTVRKRYKKDRKNKRIMITTEIKEGIFFVRNEKKRKRQVREKLVSFFPIAFAYTCSQVEGSVL